MKYKILTDYATNSASLSLLFPPSKRTIFFNIGETSYPYFLQFTEMMFKINFKFCSSKFYPSNKCTFHDNIGCLFIKNNRFYLPPLPNTYADGSVCLGDWSHPAMPLPKMLKNIMESFWTTPFSCIPANAGAFFNKFIKSQKGVTFRTSEFAIDYVFHKWEEQPQLLFDNLIPFSFYRERFSKSDFTKISSFEDIKL